MKKKILVVDDEENIRLLFKEELEEEGYWLALALALVLSACQPAASSPVTVLDNGQILP